MRSHTVGGERLESAQGHAADGYSERQRNKIMRVLLIGAYPPPHGGVQTNVVAIRTMLLDRGVPCMVMNLTRHREARDAEVYHPTNVPQVLQLLRRLPYDIVHMHHGGELTPRLVALYFLCAQLPGKRAILTCHSGGLASSEIGRSARRLSLYGCVFRSLDRIIVVNQEMVEMFKQYGVSPDRIELILHFRSQRLPPNGSLPHVYSRFATATCRVS